MVENELGQKAASIVEEIKDVLAEEMQKVDVHVGEIKKALAEEMRKIDDLAQATSKVDVIIEAMLWSHKYRGKIVVVKLGGSVMENEAALDHLLLTLVFMKTVGMKPVVVHGGGAAISRETKARGVVPRFVQGRRYTDDATLAVVREVLAGKVADSLVEKIALLEGKAVALSDIRGSNVLFGEKTTVRTEDGAEVDIGAVGRVTRVDVDKIRARCDAGFIPIIPSYTLDDATGQGLNVNADDAATEVAQELSADKLVFVSDVNGVRANPNDPASIYHTLTAVEARRLLASGAVVGGMIPKLQSCLETLKRGVEKIHIIDGRARHALLLEIFTNEGVGTEIVND